MKKFLKIILILTLPLFFVSPANTSMTGGNFELYADSFNVISNESVSGGTFTLYDTLGESFATTTSGNTFELRAGFQAMEQDVTLSMTVSASSLNLGTLSSTQVSSDSVVLTVGTNSISGYSVSVSEDGDLRSGIEIINDVTDGSVTAGSEEYGISTSGVDGLLSTDTAITNNLLVASSATNVVNRQTTLTFKASKNEQTVAGSYSHAITFTATANP